MTKSYQNNELVSRLSNTISNILSGKLSKPTIFNLTGLGFTIICVSGTTSVRHFYNCFLRSYWGKHLNTYYHTLEVLRKKLENLELLVFKKLTATAENLSLSRKYPFLC